jgi:hypothetical protein
LIASTRLSAGTLHPDEIPTVKLSGSGSADVWNYKPDADDFVSAGTADGSYLLYYEVNDAGVLGRRANVTIDEMAFNSDPFVLNNILVTNTTAVTQIYSVTVGLPTTFGAPNLIKGTVTTGIIDGDATGVATISTVTGQPIYKGQIDFATVATLQNDPFSISVSGGNSASQTNSFGLNPNAVAVLSNIGIQLTFQLTAGDTASILSRFDVVVPEPTALALSGLAAAFLLGFRRRSSR